MLQFEQAGIRINKNRFQESARSIINKKTELNIMVDDIKPHIIGITESWANNDITNAELGLEGYVMFRKDRIGRR